MFYKVSKLLLFLSLFGCQQSIPIGYSDSTPTTGTGMWIYHGENNPANDSLCAQKGHVFKLPKWLDAKESELDSCFRCKKTKLLGKSLLTDNAIGNSSMAIGSSATSLTIDDLKKCVSFDGELKTSIIGIIDVAYEKALSEGKTEQEAVSAAVTKLEEILDEMLANSLPAKMPMGEFGTIETQKYYPNKDTLPLRIDGGGSDKVGYFSIDGTNSWIPNMLEGSTWKRENIKDTILVDVACRKITTGSESVFEGYPAIIKSVRQERTFEKQMFNPPYKRDPFLGYDIIWEWKQTETRWLNDVEGCYQLTPLNESN